MSFISKNYVEFQETVSAEEVGQGIDILAEDNTRSGHSPYLLTLEISGCGLTKLPEYDAQL